jgi:hypothetical protein
VLIVVRMRGGYVDDVYIRIIDQGGVGIMSFGCAGCADAGEKVLGMFR